MTKLEKLYSIIENSREVGVKLSKDVLQKGRIMGRFFDPTVSTATHRVEDRRSIIPGLAQFGMF